MALPDASRLLGWPAERWRGLGNRLGEIALTTAHQPVAALGGEGGFEPAVRPLRNWHLRQRNDPAARAMRLLVYADPVTDDEARDALGPLSTDELVAIGLLERVAGGRIVSRFPL